MKDLADSGLFPAARSGAITHARAVIDQGLAAQTVALPGGSGRVRPAVAESPAPIRQPRRPGRDSRDHGPRTLAERRG